MRTSAFQQEMHINSKEKIMENNAIDITNLTDEELDDIVGGFTVITPNCSAA